jgi:hypothetical protein
MKHPVATLLMRVAALLVAFLSGLAASSFYIGDRNLLVTIVALGMMGCTVWMGWRFWQSGHKGVCGLLCLAGVMGYVFSVYGIC